MDHLNLFLKERADGAARARGHCLRNTRELVRRSFNNGHFSKQLAGEMMSLPSSCAASTTSATARRSFAHARDEDGV